MNVHLVLLILVKFLIKLWDLPTGLPFYPLIVGVATILAGVIGIGNILLISVKERTKELGIRRALGATPREVRSLIILESVFLTMIAGSCGHYTWGRGFKFDQLTSLRISIFHIRIQQFLYHTSWEPLAIMIILGTLIGSIPAQRAVSIKPIDALREE